MIRRTGISPASVTFDDSVFRAAGQVSPLNVNPATRQLRVNPAYPYWATIAQRAQERFAGGAWSSGHEDHVFFHEMAHLALVADAGETEYTRLRSSRSASHCGSRERDRRRHPLEDSAARPSRPSERDPEEAT